MPRLFLGNLGHDCRQRDIEKLFDGYGELRNINIKGQYGFMEIDDKRDAEDAIKDINGKNFNGGRIRIEYSNAYSGADRRGGGGSSRGGRDFDTDRGGRRVSDGKFRRTNYRLVVKNISSQTSWQDLKDHMKQAGEIIYSTVNRVNAREGLVEFKCREDMDRAIDELDDTKLDGRRIRLVEESRDRSASRSRSRSKSSSRSRSRSARRSPSGSRSKSRSRSQDKEDRFGRQSQKSPSRSRSRS